MITDSDYLIVYGTLRPAFTNPAARYLRQYSRYVGEASFPGQLFDLGNYPGVVYQPESQSKVYGSLYNINQYKEQLLAYLDTYEGIGDQFEHPHEYVRILIPIDWAGGSVNCWVYQYNLPATDKPVIQSGDYLSFTGKL